MSALVPPPKAIRTPLAKADVPRYVNAILAMSAVSDSLGLNDLLRWPLETLAANLDRRIGKAGLDAEAARVAERIRAEATGAVAPVVELRPTKARTGVPA
jgi:hypothetical protein